MTEISTSVLNMIKGKEAETIFGLEKAKTDYFHIDVMDGVFVEKNTYDYMFEVASYIKRISNLPQDVHLMVSDLKQAINDFSSIAPNIITFHIESCKNEKEVFEYIELIKNLNIKVGISVKPTTPIEEVYKYLPYVHTILIMTVKPGKGGQTLLSDMINKIKTLKEYVDKNNINIDIEADGGINLKTCEAVKDAGANILVAGTAILLANDYKVIIDELKK